jgi:hypothetical protein
VSSVERMPRRVSPRLYSVSDSARGQPAAPAAAPLVIRSRRRSARNRAVGVGVRKDKWCSKSTPSREAVCGGHEDEERDVRGEDEAAHVAGRSRS